jgi:adenine deaminase
MAGAGRPEGEGPAGASADPAPAAKVRGIVPSEGRRMTEMSQRTELHALLRRMPKAELHIHIEGSLEPELIFKLAARNGVPLAYPSVQALRDAYAFTDLQSFLDIYYAGASVLLHEQDFFDMAWAYFERAAADNVVHAELFFDPQTHTDRGVPIEPVIVGLAHACRRAHAEFGLSASLILCFLRHLSEDAAFATLEQALPHREHFIGVGLDSSERGHPPEKFARVFARCRDLGLHVVAHAGEEGPPGYIWNALDVLKVERIDHGVRCVEDPALVQRLAAERVPLTVCPLSNVKLCVFEKMADHNLPALLAAGLAATVNSDDPAYFGGYVNDNFVAAFDALPQLGQADAYTLARNSFEASFASPDQKARWIRSLDACFGRAASG